MQVKLNKSKLDVDRPPPGKIDFKVRSIAEDKKWYFIIIKLSFCQEDLKIQFFVPNNILSMYI